MTDTKIVTKAGLKKLEDELSRRLTSKRKEIADKLDVAKAVGDLSENSAYISALEEYQLNETKINELKDTIAKLKVAPDKSGDEKIDIGDKIKVRNCKTSKILEYNIVGEGEGDPSLLQVSFSSTVGKALIGKRVGERVNIKLPSGKVEYEIIDVT